MGNKNPEAAISNHKMFFEKKQKHSFRIEMCKGKLWMECEIYSEEPMTRNNSLHDAIGILIGALGNSKLLDIVVFLEEENK